GAAPIVGGGATGTATAADAAAVSGIAGGGATGATWGGPAFVLLTSSGMPSVARRAEEGQSHTAAAVATAAATSTAGLAGTLRTRGLGGSCTAAGGAKRSASVGASVSVERAPRRSRSLSIVFSTLMRQLESEASAASAGGPAVRRRAPAVCPWRPRG